MNRMWSRNRLTTEKGFILAEVTLAIFIISVALIPISGMFVQAIQADLMANHYTVAANLAQKQLELLKIHSPEYWSERALPAIIPWSDQAQLPTSQYTVLTDAVATADDSLVQVTVTVTWQERGRDCTMQFVTFYPVL